MPGLAFAQRLFVQTLKRKSRQKWRLTMQTYIRANLQVIARFTGKRVIRLQPAFNMAAIEGAPFHSERLDLLTFLH